MSKGYSKASNIVEENEANYLRGLSQDMRSMGNDSGDPYDIYTQYAKSIDEYNEYNNYTAEKLLDVKNAEFPPFRVQNYNYFSCTRSMRVKIKL